jgi:predicted ArsR family transcriptional regulator
LRTVGRLMAEEQIVPTAGARAGLEAAVDVLNELGGLAELEERDGGFVIRSYSCPLSGLTSDHPEVCNMAESQIAELAGFSARKHCDRDDRPRCCFDIALAEGTA